jgi:NDP-sugar pyrophosphorylase family protein
MKKEKIAISLDPTTLEMVDAMTDGVRLRSRSQAIEYLVRKGIEHQYVREAVILIRGSELSILQRKVDGKEMLLHHLGWLEQHGIETAYLVTGNAPQLSDIERLARGHAPLLRVVLEERPSGTMGALKLVEQQMTGNFVVMFGDTLNQFDLTKMILFHLREGKIATIGLISSPHPERYSTVELEGDRIVEFRRKDSQSHIIDAGIYIFKPTIFSFFTGGKHFERDVFPNLCHTNDIKGYFTHGTYAHLGEE